MAKTAASLVTVEIDPERAAVAEARLASFEHARVVVGDWQDVLSDCAPSQLDQLIDMLSIGGLLLVDDLTPASIGPDAARDILLAHPRLAAAEMLISQSAAVVIAARADSARRAHR